MSTYAKRACMRISLDGAHTRCRRRERVFSSEGTGDSTGDCPTLVCDGPKLTQSPHTYVWHDAGPGAPAAHVHAKQHNLRCRRVAGGWAGRRGVGWLAGAGKCVAWPARRLPS